MGSSAPRETQRNKSIENAPQKARKGGASRPPPGPEPPQMAPPTDLVVLQCKMQAHPQKLPRLPLDVTADSNARASELPEGVKANVERLSGESMADVRVFYDSEKPAEVGAHAFTQANDIHVAPGQEKHVAHEAWHAVQGKQGRVGATRQIGDGVAINDDPKLEREADAMIGEIERTVPTNETRVGTQANGAPSNSSSVSSNAPLQMRIDARMSTKWYRKKRGSPSSVVNVLIEEYNAMLETGAPILARRNKLGEIELALSWVENASKYREKLRVYAAVIDERRALDVEAYQEQQEEQQEEQNEEAAVPTPEPSIIRAPEPPSTPSPQAAPVQSLQPLQSPPQQQSQQMQQSPSAPVSSPAPQVSPIAVQPLQPQQSPSSPVSVSAPVVDQAVQARAPAPAQAQKISLDQLRAFSDVDIARICQNKTVDGPLMGLLLGAFEANWFKAKACLVFDKWPGQRPAFSHQSSLDLMSALTVLRGEVHKLIMPIAQRGVAAELQKRAGQLRGRPDLAEQLESEVAEPNLDKQVLYLGSVGADTVTSDVDVSTGGKNSELAVRVYNEAFRATLGVQFDPGTVFDLNVYSMDFVHGMADIGKDDPTVEIRPKAEHGDVALSGWDKRDRDAQQDLWALVHIARYLPNDEDWAAYVNESLAGMPSGEIAYQRKLFDKARVRAKGFNERLESMMEYLQTEDTSRVQLNAALMIGGGSQWGGDNEHFAEDALRMRAANRIYEDKLLQVKDLRLRIDQLKKQENQTPEQEEQLRGLVARLGSEVSMAQLYANEVYGSGGATVHAVFGMQRKKKLKDKEAADQLADEKDENKKYKHKARPVNVQLTRAQWYEAFNDNLGDVMKDFLHFGTAHGHQQPDYWYAAFKMGKYIDRMLDCYKALVNTKLILPDDAATLSNSAAFMRLDAVATYAIAEKDGSSRNDPQKLKNHIYFGTMGAHEVQQLKTDALWLGSQVRAMVEWAKRAR